MSATRISLRIPQGSDYVHKFSFVDENNLPVNLTGFSAAMQIRQTIPSINFEFEGTTAGGEIVVDGSAGDVTLTIPAATTTAWTWVEGVYDIEITSPAGQVTKLARGSVVVIPEVTR